MQKSLISININTGSYKTFVQDVVYMSGKDSSYTCVANVHMLVQAYSHESFARIVNNADIITPDGMPLTWGLKWLHGIKQDRVAGMDLLPDILLEAATQGVPVYFYGGSEELLSQIKDQIPEKYPRLKIAGTFSPPFRELTTEEVGVVADHINESGARLVFVVLGCPKQEMWMATMKNKINASMIGVGGALPVLLGIQPRAPRWMQDFGLEWLHRFLQEPGRLFVRYTVTNSAFVYLLGKELVRVKIFKMKPRLSAN